METMQDAGKSGMDQIISVFERLATWAYDTLLGSSQYLMLIAILVAALAIVIGIFRGIGAAVKIILSVFLAYVLIRYAPDIVTGIRNIVDPKAAQSVQVNQETINPAGTTKTK